MNAPFQLHASRGKSNRFLIQSLALTFAILVPLSSSARPTAANKFSVGTSKDQVIAVVDKNLAKGPNNFFLYLKFSHKHVAIQKGDVLEYDIFLSPSNPMPKGGVDIDFDDGSTLRDAHIPDQNGIDSHGDGLITPAVDHWYTRKISLNSFAGRRTEDFTAVFEGDAFGLYAQFLDHIKIVHANGSVSTIYPVKTLPDDQVAMTSGYSENPALALVPRSEIVNGKSVSNVVVLVEGRAKRLQTISDLNNAVALAGEIPHLSKSETQSVAASKTAIRQLSNQLGASNSQFNAAVQHVIKVSQPVATILHTLTSDLIGHAHIDVQWLWQSPESLQAAHNTWNQATIFMKEFPGFTFTQSTAGYYREVQYTWPKLFATIQKYVKDGQWEVVGGRESEADENLISPEDSAMQFLYAQRYFRKEFGKIAVVGWEPDTFGHSAQTPQIDRLGGLKYFYFCRGGKGKPLFEWEALDGSKILTYDEVAAGAWYDTALNDSNFHEWPGYVAKTGRKEMMWVYGVGNHGGGPTKEYIEQAEKWMKSPLAPTVKFSTAQAYFEHMKAEGTSKLPVIKSELEGVFLGCFTTNSKEKKLNDYSEADTVQAEAVASVAHALGGWPYPRKTFAHNWEILGFNQHHDTICGSSFHWAYQQTYPDLAKIMASDKDISRDAMENLSVQVSPAPGGPNFLVFNSLGWKRSGWVQAYLPTPLSNNGKERAVAVAPDGSQSPLYIVNPITGEVRFWATDLPSFGYRCYVLRDWDATKDAAWTIPHDKVSNAGATVSNGRLTVTFDVAKGDISSMKENGKELAGPGGLGEMVNTPEKPVIDAWNINPLVGSFPLAPIAHRAVSGPRGSGMEFEYEIAPSQPSMKPTRIWQTFLLRPGSDHVDVHFRSDWQVVSNTKDPSPFLRATFDAGTNASVATYQVPFGAVTRKEDGVEGPVQSWADISNSAGNGVSVVVDCKHGFSAQKGVLRMSLIRGNVSPDPLPNPGMQTADYEIVPHIRDWQSKDLAQRGTEIQTRILSIPVGPDAEGTSPLEYSFASVSNPAIVTTGLKLGEDGKGYVLRYFDSLGSGSKGRISAVSPMSYVNLINFIEDPMGILYPHGKSVSISLRPWQIGQIEFGIK